LFVKARHQMSSVPGYRGRGQCPIVGHWPQCPRPTSQGGSNPARGTKEKTAMRPNRTLRTLPLALACVAALALGSPAAARPSPEPSALWKWLAGFSGLSFLTGEEGGHQDPDGGKAAATAPSEAGGHQDPNGATASSADTGEAGGHQDPNG
jgi:hypothetical protein